MGNKVNLGNSNKIKESTIAGGDVTIKQQENEKKFKCWLRKHLEVIISAIISGAVSAFVAWLITYLITKS